MNSVPGEAARWWRVMRDEAATAADKREFADWVAQSPKHIEEMLRMARLHRAVSNPKVRWPTIDAESLIREAKESRDDTVFSLSSHQAPKAEVRQRRVRALTFGLAAAVVLAVGVSWLTSSRPERFQTKIGEQRSVMLADGSRVTLNTESQIEVQLFADHRVVDLVSGEAIFEVAHDARRPFDVRVGDVVARAVGTQFEVDRRATRTIVTVIEGRVAVTAGERRLAQPLTAGDRVIVDDGGPRPVEKGVNLSDAVAWTQRQLVFRNRPLEEVAEELNRYNQAHVEIRSPALQKQEVTGIFRTDDLTSFVALLAGKEGVRVTSDGSGGYIVTAHDSVTPPGK
jgi:transmembrane sensor